MALAYALQKLEQDRRLSLTNYGNSWTTTRPPGKLKFTKPRPGAAPTASNGGGPIAAAAWAPTPIGIRSGGRRSAIP